LFIAFIGLKGAGMVIDNQYTFVAIADLTKWSNVGPFLAAFLGLIAIVLFNKSNIKALKSTSVILGILVSSVLFYLFTWKVINSMPL